MLRRFTDIADCPPKREKGKLYRRADVRERVVRALIIVGARGAGERRRQTVVKLPSDCLQKIDQTAKAKEKEVLELK